MSQDIKAELLDTIFRAFPNASIVSKTPLNHRQQYQDSTTRNPSIAQSVKMRPAVSRSGKKKVLDSGQQSLFDDEIIGGGI